MQHRSSVLLLVLGCAGSVQAADGGAPAFAFEGLASPTLRLTPGRAMSAGEAWEWVRAQRAERRAPELEPVFSAAEGRCGEYDVDPASQYPDWQIASINGREGWKHWADAGALPGDGVVVCVLDTGYTEHPELLPSLAGRGFDFVSRLPDGGPAADARDRLPSGDAGSESHGTATASVIAGPHGVAPGARVLPLRVSARANPAEVGFAQNVADALDQAVRQGCQVVSVGVSTPFSEGRVRAAAARAAEAGAIVVAPAGECTGVVSGVAAYPGVIAVGGINFHNNPWRYANDGPDVAISAPADVVWYARTRRDGAGGYDDAHGAGTSLAAAQVAGAAALWLSSRDPKALHAAYPNRADVPRAFRWLLGHAGARRGDWEPPVELGSGVVDVRGLVNAPLPSRKELGPELGLRKMDRAAWARQRLSQLWRVTVAQTPAELAKRAGVTGAQAKEALDHYGDELTFQAEADQATRAQRGVSSGMSVEMSGVAGAFGKRLAAEGSPSLKKALGLQ